MTPLNKVKLNIGNYFYIRGRKLKILEVRELNNGVTPKRYSVVETIETETGVKEIFGLIRFEEMIIYG